MFIKINSNITISRVNIVQRNLEKIFIDKKYLIWLIKKYAFMVWYLNFSKLWKNMLIFSNTYSKTLGIVLLVRRYNKNTMRV